MTDIAKQIFGDIKEVLVEQGIAYYPLLVDPLIERELPKSNSIKKKKGSFFIRGLSIDSAIESFPKAHPMDHEFLKKALLKKIDLDSKPKISGGNILETLIFEVMPYFLDKKKLGMPKSPSRREILASIRENIGVPKSSYAQAKSIYSAGDNHQAIKSIDHMIKYQKIPSGIVTIDALNPLLQSAIERRMLMDEKEKMKKDEKTMKKLAKQSIEDIATLLCLKEKKEFELQDFGFMKERRRWDEDDECYCEEVADYTAYLKIGAYALKDFDGKIYPLKPCRIGLEIYANKSLGNAFSIGKYKSPFVPPNSKDYDICVGDAENNGKNFAERIISELEMGKTALLSGYFGNLTPHCWLKNLGITPIGKNNPRIKSGKLKITNDAFIEVEK